ncbi:MAG: hypothetical protein KDK70_36700, partial [Myxococcales bacterium]|nr:hypothetical protein [Myxococcales bacterium]
LLWARSLGGGDYFDPTDLEITPAGDIAVLLDTDHGETTTVDVDAQCTAAPPVGGDMHVLAYDLDGTLQWSRHDPWEGGIFDATAGGLAFDGTTGYMAGSFHDATFGLGESGQAHYETEHRDAAVSAFSY